ncbi:gluconokinase [Micromonospora sp. NPDC049679]|uniref:gluconokinase n=1 Tax=Micromonospora sp. NPDC049679 TaxID=3155920 RepID=UPI0033C99667
MADPPAPPPPTTTVVVMGVAGAGKTTVAMELVRRLGWDYAEGDGFHPTVNVEKMRSGRPLDDEDRWPWLRAIARWIHDHQVARKNVIVTSSALRRAYRDLLRKDNPSVWFVHLNVPRDVLRDRLVQRRRHYMPASLLDSQLDTLEPLQPDEPGTAIPGDVPPEIVVDHVLEALGRERPTTLATSQEAP